MSHPLVIVDDMRLIVTAIANRLDTEADAYEFIEELRWGTGDPICPHCDP